MFTPWRIPLRLVTTIELTNMPTPNEPSTIDNAVSTVRVTMRRMEVCRGVPPQRLKKRRSALW